MDRRKFINRTGKAAAGSIVATSALSALSACGSSKKSVALPSMNYYDKTPGLSQRPLPYNYAALEPAIDSLTMEIHYTKHAAAYANNLKEAIAGEAATVDRLETLFANMGQYSEKMRNNAGGHYNHERFWTWMTPGGKEISGNMKTIVEKSFGKMSDLKAKMSDSAAKRFGSGWAWLYVNADKQLAVGSTANQDNPLMSTSDLHGYPILGIDVWEHAYYLKYQNKRADYFNAWWSLVNWAEVEATYKFAIG